MDEVKRLIAQAQVALATARMEMLDKEEASGIPLDEDEWDRTTELTGTLARAYSQCCHGATTAR